MSRNSLTLILFSAVMVALVAFTALSPDIQDSDDITTIVMNDDCYETVTTGVTSVTEKITETTSFTDTNTKKSVTSVTTSTTTITEKENEIPTEILTETITEIFIEPVFIDINNADIEELMLLDGIGEVIARAIVEYRQEYGDFANIEEIMNVNGIGEKKFENIRDFIFVQNPVYPFEEEVYDDVQDSEVFQDTEEEYYAPPVEEEPVTEITLESCVPININTADVEILMLLPYVDEQIAHDIIKLREDIGGFSHVYELLYIDNLTQKQVAELTLFVTVGE